MFLDEPPPRSGAAAAALAPGPRWHWSDLAASLFVIFAAFIGVSVALVLYTGNEPLDEGAVAAIVATIGFELAFAGGVLLLALRHHIGWRELGFVRPRRWSPIFTAWFGSYAVLITYQVVLTLLDNLGIDTEQFGEGNQVVLGDDPGLAAVIALGVAVVVVAPFCEEIFFRALWFRGLRRYWNVWPAALLSGAIFGAFHLNPSVVLPFTVVGMLFAWAVEESGSLWSSIAAHTAVNGVSFLATVLIGVSGVDS